MSVWRRFNEPICVYMGWSGRWINIDLGWKHSPGVGYVWVSNWVAIACGDAVGKHKIVVEEERAGVCDVGNIRRVVPGKSWKQERVEACDGSGEKVRLPRRAKARIVRQ